MSTSGPCSFPGCRHIRHSGDLCSAHATMRRKGIPLYPLRRKSIPVEERFWAKVNKDGPTQPHMESPCWLWLGSLGRPYGEIGVGARGQRYRAHRLSWMLSFGDIPTGMHVCHRCDTPACVRPDHLWVGTNAENRADMMAKGRGNGPRGNRHRSKTHPETVGRGESASCVKLSDSTVRAMLNGIANGATYADLARAYGVNKETVRRIGIGKTWTHIERER